MFAELDADAGLMLQVREGDTAAFNKLLAKYQRPLINFMYRFINRYDVAEDLAQEVFLRIYQARHRYQAEARFSSWLYRIATNLCLKEIARSKKRPQPLVQREPADATEEDPLEHIADPRPSALQQLQAAEREQLFAQCLQALAPHERAALLLRKYHDMSYKEIAEALNCSEGAVKTWIHRGKLHLRQQLLPYLQMSKEEER